MSTTILLVDDHPVFRQGLNHLLAKEKDLTIVGEAGDGQMALEQVQRKQPDLVVMDINMPNLNGIEATRQILSEAPETKIVAMSVHSGKQFVRDMIQAGASGYILKESIPEEMITGIRTVLAGDVFLSKSISNLLVSDYRTLVEEFDPETDEPSVPILYTKLSRPPISSHIIPRARLVEAIENGIQNPMTLIAAPAGYGKSILASQWLEVSQLPGAWLSLDESDSDLRLFVKYVLEAIQNLLPDHELKTKSLISGAKMPPAKVLSQHLLNDLADCSVHFVLVIDDYHLISNSDVHDFLSELLIHPSPVMHLVLITRRDPMLPLSSLRARGILTEIGLSAIRFTAKETKMYLERFLHIPITEKTLHVLEEKMEGWVTGLHLAALSIMNESDQERMVEGLQKTPLYVQDYLVKEVLARTPKAVEQLILKTAVVDRFCAALCDELMDKDASHMQAEPEITGREFIDWLTNMYIFIIPLDSSGIWFRFHHLFQQILQDQLKQRYRTEEIAGIHSRASAWLAQNQYYDEAIKHAVAAGESETAAQIIEQNRQTILNKDQWYILEKWLSILPDNVIRQRPKLLLTNAWQRYHHFNILEIPPLVDSAEALLSDSRNNQSLKGEIDFFRGYFAYFQNDGKKSLKHLTNARKRVPEKNYEIYGQVEILHGLAMQMQGQMESALNRLNDLRNRRQWATNIVQTRLLATIVYIHVISGNLDQAVTANQQLNSVSTKYGYAYAKAWSVYLQGLILFYRNELEGAIDCFSQAIEQKHILQTRAVIDSMAGLAYAYQATGQPDHATGIIKRLFKFVEATDDPTGFIVADACEIRLAILQNETKAVSGFLQSVCPPVENMVWWLEIPAVTYCRALLFRGKDHGLKKTEATLRELLTLNQDNHNICHMIQILSLQALVCKKQNRLDEALGTLEQAVGLAAPGGWVRPFVEAGPPMVGLLEKLQKKNVESDFVERLLAAFEDDRTAAKPQITDEPLIADKPPIDPPPAVQPLIDPLTNRELDVLELLAKRLQNKEIADKLCISDETVKGHLKNIYQKLNVGNRRQAVEKAKRQTII